MLVTVAKFFTGRGISVIESFWSCCGLTKNVIFDLKCVTNDQMRYRTIRLKRLEACTVGGRT